jgi:hypothetical protein
MIGMPSTGTTLPMASEIAAHMLREPMVLIRLHRRLAPIDPRTPSDLATHDRESDLA